jgi:hypothetical protein
VHNLINAEAANILSQHQSPLKTGTLIEDRRLLVGREIAVRPAPRSP